MGILLLFLCLVLYFLLFTSLIKKQGNTFLIAYIVYIWIYDWLFINLSYFISNDVINILKLGNEALVILAILILIGKKVKVNNIDKTVGICFIFTMLYAITISLINNIPFSQILQGIRMYFGPVIYVYVIYKLDFFHKISLPALNKSLIFLLLISLAYSAHQAISFTGSLPDLWFYEYFKDTIDFDITHFNYIRDEKLRATSFFVSPISASIFFSSISLFIISLNKNKMFNIIIFLLGGAGLYLSRTRIGFIYIGLFIVLLVLLNRTKFKYLIIATLFAVATTIVSLLYGISDDASALGRLVQYNNFLSVFRPLGYGSDELILIKFDSYIISIFIFLGFFAILIISGIIMLAKENYRIYNLSQDKSSKQFLTFIIVNTICIIYELFFQYIAGSYLYKLTFLLLFVGIAYEKIIKKENV